MTTKRNDNNNEQTTTKARLGEVCSAVGSECSAVGSECSLRVRRTSTYAMTKDNDNDNE